VTRTICLVGATLSSFVVVTVAWAIGTILLCGALVTAYPDFDPFAFLPYWLPPICAVLAITGWTILLSISSYRRCRNFWEKRA